MILADSRVPIFMSCYRIRDVDVDVNVVLCTFSVKYNFIQ